MVVEARKLSERLKKNTSTQEDAESQNSITNQEQILQSLDALGYDEAAQYVYGMNYGDWKKAHAKKASDDQMQKFNDSKPVWASHDKQILAKRADAPAEPLGKLKRAAPSSDENESGGVCVEKPTQKESSSNALLSNVCCQDVDDVPPPPAKKVNTNAATDIKTSRQVNTFATPAAPNQSISIRLGVLTVSDRASSGGYETGDLSGPAVESAVQSIIKETMPSTVKLSSVTRHIVPDDKARIEQALTEWADSGKLNLILTTGGTGFGERDVTPEATKAIVDRDCSGLVSFCTFECSKTQPLAALSRGAAGLRGNTLIANLPGNPMGVAEIVPILLPLSLHILKDLKQ